MSLLPLDLLNDTGWVVLFRELFSNMCIIIALTFIYMQLRWKWLGKRVAAHIHFVDGLAGGMLGIILMYYSIRLSAHLILDLRYVAIVLVVLFCGYRAAMISSSLIILARLSLGLEFASYASLPFIALLLGGFALMNVSRLGKMQLFGKGMLMIIYSNVLFSIMIFMVIRNTQFIVKTASVYWILATCGGFVALFFVDYIKRSHELFLKYEAESSTDFLTGLNNVRQFDLIWNEAMRNAVERSERLSLLAIDIDFFKKVNDTFGHAGGDLVLEELGAVLKAHARSFDIVSRNGGEEFSIILPDCSNSQAVKIAERVRCAVEDHSFPVGSDGGICITVSIGIASFPETTADPAAMLHLADECLYRAKQTGRNRVCAEPAEKEPVPQME